MVLHDTSDISDDEIKKDLLNANSLYLKVMNLTHTHLSEDGQKRAAGLVRPCCSPEDLEFLLPLVRLFIANYATVYGERIPHGYAASAVLYCYYQLVLIETGITSVLDLSVLRFFQLTPQQIHRLHFLTNFIIISDEPYISEIRRAMLALNPEPFVGGRKRGYKNKSRRRKTRKTRKHR